MRTLEEIEADTNAAIITSDHATLRALAVELQGLGTLKAEAIAVRLQGIASALIGDYSSALENFQRALPMYEAVGDQLGIVRLLNNMGIVYDYTGSYPLALEYFRRALGMCELLGSSEGLANVTSSMGLMYTNMGDYSKALECYDQALAWFEENGDVPGRTVCTGNIGVVYYYKKEYDTALEYYYKALAMYKEMGDLAGVANYTGNIIMILLEQGRLNEADHLLREQATMVMEDPLVRAEHAANHARLSELMNDLDAAKEQLTRAIDIATEAGRRSDAAEFHKRMRDLAQRRNDLQSYVYHNAEHLRIAEEIRGREASQKLALLETERRIQEERAKNERERALLYGALPESIATRMLRGEDVSGDHFDQASVLFLDIAGFTTISDRIPPGHVVHLLKAIFKVCDEVCRNHGLTKIKTIGDSYLAVAGVPEPVGDHVQRAAEAALDLLSSLNALELTMDPNLGDTSWTKDVGEINVRIGLHCGPLVAGIVGEQRLQYDVWGDTVNVASRMESTGEPGRIQVSSEFHEQLSSRGSSNYRTVERGVVEIKGKGAMITYWLE